MAADVEHREAPEFGLLFSRLRGIELPHELGNELVALFGVVVRELAFPGALNEFAHLTAEVLDFLDLQVLHFDSQVRVAFSEAREGGSGERLVHGFHALENVLTGLAHLEVEVGKVLKRLRFEKFAEALLVARKPVRFNPVELLEEVAGRLELCVERFGFLRPLEKEDLKARCDAAFGCCYAVRICVLLLMDLICDSKHTFFEFFEFHFFFAVIGSTTLD